MTGPDHYAEAERLLNIAEASKSQEQHGTATARAQVHATLALAAATADPEWTPEWEQVSR